MEASSALSTVRYVVRDIKSGSYWCGGTKWTPRVSKALRFTWASTAGVEGANQIQRQGWIVEPIEEGA